MARSLMEATAFTNEAYRKVLKMVEEDDGSCPERTERLKKAEYRLDIRVEALQGALECNDME
jgi:hypothetical protein